MAKLRIKKLHDGVWKIFGFQFNQAVADRDCLKSEIEKRLGSETASDIQLHVDLALERLQADAVPNPLIMSKSEFFDLLAAEMKIQEIADRIDANALFVDSNGLLPTLGFSWQEDVLPLIDGQKSPGFMPIENVNRFLEMVRGAKQRIPADSAEETAEYFRKRRRELVIFLERAVKLCEPVWCDL